MKKLLAIVLLLGSLVGCSEEKVEEKTIVCTYSQSGLVTENAIVYEGDKVVKQTLTNQIDYEMFGLTKEQTEYSTEEYAALYDVNGVEYTYSIEGTILTETIVIDYKKADLNELSNASLIQMEEDAKYVSFEKTIESLENSGFICK